MDDRKWMYDGRRSRWDFDDEWQQKTNEFLERAFGNSPAFVLQLCPCFKCENRRRQNKVNMGRHLLLNGFTKGYTVWRYHGESGRIREEVVRPRLESFDADAGVADMVDDVYEACFDSHERDGMMEDAREFYKMMESATKPLHEHSEVSQLDTVGRLMGLKSDLNMSREGFDKTLTVIASLLPKPNNLPANQHAAEKVLKSLKMPYEQIHACPKGCVLFRNEHADATHCPKCKTSRFMEVDCGNGQKKQLNIAEKILRYLPFIPRIQRLFMTEDTAKQMTWHKQGKRYHPDKMVHPSDGEAWRYFDEKHPDKAGESRNVRVAIATDGFNPYGMSSAPHTCWPVFVIPLNLPPGIAFQRQNVFCSLIIPGHPGKNMGVYMDLIWDELITAWNDGVWTYDRATKKSFKMYVWYQYSIHDFVAYGLFSGWCVHGRFPCPICKTDARFNWLLKGGKYSSFDLHRQFLPLNHAFRQDIKNFTKGVKVLDPPPHMSTPAEVHAQIEALVANPGGGFQGYGVEHMWTHKSGLTRLPYVDDLLVPHYIDYMHTEKNIAEGLFGTIMDTDKSKDNPKARVDMATLCDRPSQEMRPPVGGKRWTRPKADYMLTIPQRREVLQWMKELMFPDGYAANLRRGVNLTTLRVNGMKSHDFHVWIQRLLPAMVRGYVPEHLWLLLAELSYFFRQLSAKELSVDVIKGLEKTAPVLLCKLEKVFPPGFFVPMQHLIVHLPYEARMGGPQQYRWMYPVERVLKTVRKKCRNKARPEASIAQAYVVEEVSNFTQKYYTEKLPSVHNPLPRYNAGENESTLSLFRGQLGTASGWNTKQLNIEEWRKIMLYILTNLDETESYRK